MGFQDPQIAEFPWSYWSSKQVTYYEDTIVVTTASLEPSSLVSCQMGL